MPIGSSAAVGRPAQRCEHHQRSGALAEGTGTPAARGAQWAVKPVRAVMLGDRCMEGKPLVGGRAATAPYEKRPSSHEAARPFRFRP